jgi:hypothetical protein
MLMVLTVGCQSQQMTDDEILEKATEILAKRAANALTDNDDKSRTDEEQV